PEERNRVSSPTAVGWMPSFPVNRSTSPANSATDFPTALPPEPLGPPPFQSTAARLPSSSRFRNARGGSGKDRRGSAYRLPIRGRNNPLDRRPRAVSPDRNERTNDRDHESPRRPARARPPRAVHDQPPRPAAHRRADRNPVLRRVPLGPAPGPRRVERL